MENDDVVMKTKVEDIRMQMEMYLETVGYDCQDLSRRSEKHPIEIVVEMNKSQNQMMDECLKPQSQLIKK